MKTFKSLRIQLGISQIELAQYLGLTRSQVQMAETGFREHTTKTLLKAALLEASLYQAPLTAITEKIATLATRQGQVRLSLWIHNLRLRHKQLALLQTELQRMKQGYTGALRRYHAFAWLLSETTSPDPLEKQWLEDKLRRAEKKLASCGDPEQGLLSLKILLLTAEVTILNQYLDKKPADPVL